MKVLVLQLKRIGDLILTTPLLEGLRAALPGVEITLVVDGGCASLLPAIEGLAEGIAYRRGSLNASLWARVLGGGFDVCLDLTGSDRSALLCRLSRARRRITFQSATSSALRAGACNQWVDSPVRDHHTVDHYLHLLAPLAGEAAVEKTGREPRLCVPAGAGEAAEGLLAGVGLGQGRPFVLVHPGTARPEKYWLAVRWAETIRQLQGAGRRCVISCGPDGFERGHVAEILEALEPGERPEVLSPKDLLVLAALVERAALVLSCDTAVVHLAAAFQRPQVALFGPTNPFHWRPRHGRALVLSGANPDGPLRNFTPRLKKASMADIPGSVLVQAIAALDESPT